MGEITEFLRWNFTRWHYYIIVLFLIILNLMQPNTPLFSGYTSYDLGVLIGLIGGPMIPEFVVYIIKQKISKKAK